MKTDPDLGYTISKSGEVKSNRIVCWCCAGRGYVRGNDARESDRRCCNGESHPVPVTRCGYCDDGFMSPDQQVDYRIALGEIEAAPVPYHNLPQEMGNHHRQCSCIVCNDRRGSVAVMIDPGCERHRRTA